MKLAMSNIAWSPQERFEAYRAMAEAGFAGLEIAPGLFFHAADDPFLPEEVCACEALAEIADFGLGLVSMQSLLFGVEGAALFAGEEARAAFTAGMERAIVLAGRLGIPNVVFGSPAQRRVPEGMAMERALGEATEVFRALGDMAQGHATRIAIEANPAAYGTNFLTTFEEATGFVRRVDHPAIVAILDLGAMHMNGSFDEVSDLLAAGAAPMLSHVHVSEPQLAPAPAEPARLLPVLRALEAQGYDRAVSIEMKRPEGGIAEVRTAIARLAEAARSVETADA
jgi:sugar phosphate isomerase/epimerase